MVGSPSKKFWQTWNICRFLENCWLKIAITYPTWTIIIPTLSIWSENADFEMRVRDRDANEHTVVKWLGGKFTGRK